MAGKKLEQDFVKLSDNVSLSYIIQKMAELDGARWWVDAYGTFNYVPMGTTQGVYSITINQDQRPISADCLALKIARNVQAGKSIKVTVKSWHPKKKQALKYESTVGGTGGPIEYNYHFPTLETDTLKKRAQSQATEKARHELTVHTTVVGDPTVSAGMGLMLNGTDFDQVFEIDAVQHQIGMGGHTTSITARSPKEGRSAS